MAKLIDYNCKYADFSGISASDAESKGLTIPEAYFHAEQIAALADKDVVLPFDPVLEAENIGGNIKFDDSPLGPRKDTDLISKIDELADLPKIDVTKGRLAETIKAVKLLREQGGEATIELHGPITILNGVADIMKILMGWRKKPEIMDAFFADLIEGLTDFAVAVREAGCEVIYYTDSPGSLNILGPKFAKQITENFTVPFLKALDEKLDKGCVIHLCPKTSFLLAGCEQASWEKIHFDSAIPYKEACKSVCGQVRFLGQRCRKADNIDVTVINYLKLK